MYPGPSSVLTDIKQNLSILGVGLNLYEFSHPEVTCLAGTSHLDSLSSGNRDGYLQMMIHVTCHSYLRMGCLGSCCLSFSFADYTGILENYLGLDLNHLGD